MALENIRTAGGVPKIIATGADGWLSLDDMQATRGYRAIAHLAGSECCFDERDDVAEAIGAIYAAVVVSRLPVQHLELGSQDHGVPLDAFMILPPDDGFRDLHTLKLTLAPQEGGSSSFQANAPPDKSEVITKATYLVLLLCIAPSIKSLELAIDYIDHGFHALTFAALAMRSSAARHNDQGLPALLPSLVDLKLRGHGIRPEMLLSFIQTRSSKLRKVELRDIRNSNCVHENIYNEIWKLISHHGSDAELSIADCYDGDAWMPPWAKELRWA